MQKNIPILDPHTFAKPEEVIITHSELDIQVDFAQHIIIGKVVHTISNKMGSDKLILDCKDIIIEKVTLGGNEKETTFALTNPIPFKGSALEININKDTNTVTIYYQTTPQSFALQWLKPIQTAGGKLPFLFTQSEAILARTWVPCQDSPGIRFTYHAKVKVPTHLMAVMSATNPTQKTSDGIYHFSMKQPIPSYLLALAVGDLVYRPLGKRTGVYAEPSEIDKAAYEFVDMEKMVIAAEGLYGVYRWEQFDVIVLPPSFPFGGMENPRLTFATPTILSSDRSLVSLIAHELAHSWSGNLVTNATWNDFWLNEGFTVYFERRIMEKLEGKSYNDMLTVLGYQDMMQTMVQLGQENEDTHLKLKLDQRDPDDGMTLIAYEKGFFLLLLIEKTVGRAAWDAFLKTYFNRFAFTSMNTEHFVNYIKSELFKNNQDLINKIHLQQWIYEAGLPTNCPKVISERFEAVETNIRDWEKGKPAKDIDCKNWTTHEWLHFFRKLPQQISPEQMQELDHTFHFTQSGNAEILCAWFKIAINNKYNKAFPAIEAFLMKVGRRKFLVPLYKALVNSEAGINYAKDIYSKARQNYHYVSTNTLDEMFK
ncbi:MAG: aminopeptidase [Bacteroidetes bacterium CG2_30_32_10]|nr:MAG: aminopeptidase [Bacteroidetes bacterium CG2_30_32_10]